MTTALTTAPEPALQPPARIIGRRYRLLAPIGKGGMGVVWRAYDQLTGQAVALKQVNSTPQTMGSAAVNTRRILAQEFRTLASLRHPNIISVLDYGFDQDAPYFTMELVENAQTLLQAGADAPQRHQLGLIVQVLQALAYLHRRGIIHRDLKPGNVLVTQDHVRVVDLGLAKQRGYISADQVAGTLAYAAPEVLQGRPMMARNSGAT